MNKGKLLALAICFMLLLTGCNEYSTITDCSPETAEPIMLNPGDTQSFDVTVQDGEYKTKITWEIINDNPSSSQYDESKMLLYDYISGKTNYQPNVDSAGSYQVHCTVTDYIIIYQDVFYSIIPMNLHKSSITWNVIVKGIEVLPETNISISPGDSQTYTAAAYPKGNYDYSWFVDDVQVGKDEKYTFTPTPEQCGLHTLKVTAQGEGEEFTYSQVIIVPLAKIETSDYFHDHIDFSPCIDNGYYIAGCVGSISGDILGNGSSDGYVSKLDAEGRVVWRTLCGGEGSDTLSRIIATTDGGCIAAGESRSPVIGDSTNSSDTDYSGNFHTDVYIVKLDGNGEILWQKLFGAKEFDDIIDILQTSDGGCIAVCDVETPISNNLVVKLNSSGDVEWERYILERPSLGHISKIVESVAGDYILAGSLIFHNENSAEEYTSKGYICKLSQGDGSTVSQIIVDIVSSIQDITPSIAGGYLVADKYTVAEIDESGGVIWQKIYNDADEQDRQTIHNMLGRYDTGYVIASFLETDEYYRGTSRGMVMVLDEAGATLKQILFGEKISFNDIPKIMPMLNGKYITLLRLRPPYDFTTNEYYLVPVDINTD
jgi:hypothetical protein